MIDIVKETIGLKKAYGNARGADLARGIPGPSGLPIIAANTLIPRTTWADIAIVSAHLEKHINPTSEQCIEMVVQDKGYNRQQSFAFCEMGPRGENPRKFEKTGDFNRARELFMKYSPTAVAMKAAGPFGAPAYVVNKLASAEVFPHNEEFWGAALRYATARSAAGAVPLWNEIALDSIKDAVEALPSTMQDAASAAFETIDPSKLIPDLSAMAALIKWGSIAGAGMLLYWYVLRPRSR